MRRAVYRHSSASLRWGLSNSATLALSTPNVCTGHIHPASRLTFLTERPGHSWDGARSYGIWSEFKKSLKDRAEDNKQLKESLEQLQEHQTLTKAKETLDQLSEKSKEGVDKVKKVVESQTAVSGELLKEGMTKVSDVWDKVKETTKIDEALADTADKTMKTIDKTVDLLDKTEQAVKSTAEQSAIYKRGKEWSDKLAASFSHASKNIPLLGSGASTGSGEENGNVPPGALVVTKTADAIQQRIRQATAKLRETHIYKSAAKLKERLAESENPAIQKVWEMTDSATYHLGRIRKRVLSETDTAKTFKAVRAYGSQFDPPSFVQYARTQLLPNVREALLRYDFAALEPLVSPAFIEALKAESEQLFGPGFEHLSQLLDVESVEIHTASLEEDGLPILELLVETEETFYIKDTEGKSWNNSAEDYIRHMQHLVVLQLTPDGVWLVTSWAEVSEAKRSW